MADPNEQAKSRGERPDEDTEAILNRRRFLIASALAGAGLGAVAGCDPEPCLKVGPPPRKAGSKPSTRPAERKPKTPDQPEPKPCLTPELPKPKTAAQPKPKPGTAPRPCLSVIRPPGPRGCLKIAPKPKTPSPPKPKICLSMPHEP